MALYNFINYFYIQRNNYLYIQRNNKFDSTNYLYIQQNNYFLFNQIVIIYGQRNMNLNIEIWSLFCMDLKEKHMKRHICPAAIPMATKLGRVVTCGGGTPSSKSYDLLII